MANEVSAILKGVRISPKKARLVADRIRRKTVDHALNILNFSPKKGAEIIKKVLESAIANAENNKGADVDELMIKTIYLCHNSLYFILYFLFYYYTQIFFLKNSLFFLILNFPKNNKLY